MSRRATRAALAVTALTLSPLSAQEMREVHHANGALKERFQVDAAGLKDGLFESFREDGTPEVRAVYKADQLHGEFVAMDPAGEVRLEAQYRNGVRSGYWREFEGGVRRLAANYRNDVLEGRWESFYADGSRHVLAAYKKGLREGRFTELRPGAWEHTAAYRHGELHGKAKVTVARKTVSTREWRDGTLLRLDGIEAFPIPQVDLDTELAHAAELPDTDPADPLSGQRVRALARLRAYRALCGLPWRHLELVPEWNALCDAAGAVCEANGGLSHTPPKPPGMDEELYRRGYLGASNSNLSAGGLVGSVDSYMDDSDPTNIDRIGHRRWCLNPPMGKVGFGASGRYSAMWAMDASGPGAGAMDAVYYPPRGFVPVGFFGARHAWSIQILRGGTAVRDEDLTVDVVPLDADYLPAADPLPLDWKAMAAGGFGSGACVVFRPVGVECRAGARYRVSVSFDGGETRRFDYVVEFVGPG